HAIAAVRRGGGQPFRAMVRRSCPASALDRAGAARPRGGGVRSPRPCQRGRTALLPGDGHALSPAHRRAMRGRGDGASLTREYLEALRVRRRVSPATLRNYRQALSLLLKLLGETPLEALQPAQVRRFAATLHSRGLSPPSLALTLSAWRGCYAWLARNRGLRANPVLGVRAPKAARPLPKALSVEAAQRLLDETPDTLEAARDAAMFELL